MNTTRHELKLDRGMWVITNFAHPQHLGPLDDVDIATALQRAQLLLAAYGHHIHAIDVEAHQITITCGAGS